MKIHHVEQRTDAWFRLRMGIPCTSGFKNLITPKGKPTKNERRTKYMNRLICERLLQYSMDDKFENYWTERGRDLEHPAAEAFAEFTGYQLLDGCFLTDDKQRIGCSPDRIIGDSYKDARMALEIKCPSPWEHLGYLLQGLDDDYKSQVQGQLLVGEFDMMHFWSWHPQMPPYHIVTVRDDDYIEVLARELLIFCKTLDDETERARAVGEFKPGREAMYTPGVFPWMDQETMQ